jgi:hypothetical protein
VKLVSFSVGSGRDEKLISCNSRFCADYGPCFFAPGVSFPVFLGYKYPFCRYIDSLFWHERVKLTRPLSAMALLHEFPCVQIALCLTPSLCSVTKSWCELIHVQFTAIETWSEVEAAIAVVCTACGLVGDSKQVM